MGSSIDKQKEEVMETAGVEFIMGVLCNHAEDRDFDEFDDASDMSCSIQSSTMESHGSDAGGVGSVGNEMETDVIEEDWEQLNEKDREEELGKSMKKIKMKKKEMSPFIMKDMLGGDGDACLTDLKKTHTKRLKAHELRVNEV